jgi:hypothetical protein
MTREELRMLGSGDVGTFRLKFLNGEAFNEAFKNIQHELNFGSLFREIYLSSFIAFKPFSSAKVGLT